MTEKNVIAIDDPKNETVNSRMTPRINSMDEDDPNDEFVDKRASNEYDSSEELSTFNNVQVLAAKKKAVADQPKFTPILLENQATSVIESIIEGKDEKKKNFDDERDDKSNILIKGLCVIENFFKNFTRYGINEKDFYRVSRQFSGNSTKEIPIKSEDRTHSQGVNAKNTDGDGSLQCFINREDVDNEHREEVEDDKKDLNDDIDPADIPHGPGFNEKNVDSCSGDHDNIQKKDVTENMDNENFCHRSKCDSGFSDLGSQQGCFTNPENGESEHRKRGKDDKTETDINKGPSSGTLNPRLDTNVKDQETWERDEHVHKKHLTEYGDVSHVTTLDSGFSDPPSLPSYEGIDTTHPAGEEDDESTRTGTNPQSCQLLDPAPNVNLDDKLFGMGDEGITEKQDCKDDSTLVGLDPDPTPNPKNQISATVIQEHIQTKEISTKHSALKGVPNSDALLGPLQDIKSLDDQDTRHHTEENDDTQNRKDNRQPVILDPDPTSAKRYKSATGMTGDQRRVEGTSPTENEDINHVTSCGSDASDCGSVRPPERPSKKDWDSRERPKEEGMVDVTDKNDGGQRVYSRPDTELSCSSLAKKQAKGDPIQKRPYKKEVRIKRGYLHDLGARVIRFRILFVIVLFFAPSAKFVFGMNPVWYKEGDNAIIDFPLESYLAVSIAMTLNVRMDSMPQPFYSNGIRPDGFKDESQTRRFNVSRDIKGIKINIADAQKLDEDVYKVTLIFYQDDGSSNDVSWSIQLKCLSPVQCHVLNDSSYIVVHCNTAVASPETALYCFHGISFCSPYPRPDIADGQAEFRMKKSGEPIRCCSKAQVDPSVSISVSHETCHDFIWPQTMPTTPTSTYDKDGVATSAQGVNLDGDGGTPPYQTIPHTPSSCSRLRNVPSLIIALVLSWFFV